MSSLHRYRKRPVEVYAIQMPIYPDVAAVRGIAEWMALNGYDANPNGTDLDQWVDEYVLRGEGHDPIALPHYGVNFLEIETLEGTMSARPGDYIIRGVQGEFYPCKPGVFTATYEEVDSDE